MARSWAKFDINFMSKFGEANAIFLVEELWMIYRFSCSCLRARKGMVQLLLDFITFGFLMRIFWKLWKCHGRNWLIVFRVY